MDWDSIEVTPSGRYTELEWTMHPDWYRHDTHWRGFGPTRVDSIPSIGSPWYLDMDTPVAYCTVKGRFSFTEHQRGNVTNDLTFFDGCLTEIIATKHFVNNSPIPPPYDRERLAATFHSIIALQKEGAAAKRAAWDRLAFLTWWTSACDNWAVGVDKVTAERVECIVLRGRVCFHFTVVGGLNNSPQVVFWRFRPKVPLAHQCEHLLWDQRVNEPVVIRELFKGAYAPSSSRRFHPELGTLQTSSFQSQGPSSVDHSRPTLSHLPLASRLSMAWETSSADNDSPVNYVPSLLARMSHQGTSFKKIPVRQVSHLESSGSNSRDTSRSRSPQS